MRGGGTMPAIMGMMMLSRMIMYLCGDLDSWDQRSLRIGMMGGMGMGGMGMGGMGGMGMGGMGGGFRSVPPTGRLETTLQPDQTRHLPTPVVSMNGPDAKAQPLVPPKGERFQITGINEFTDDVRTQQALKRLAEAKAPQTIAQMIIWYVTDGASWDQIGRLSQGWGNASELALARQFVESLDDGEEPSSQAHADPGPLYWDIKAEGARPRELADGLRAFWKKYPVLGLTAQEGVPAQPVGPAVACEAELSETAADVKLKVSHPSGYDWIPLGSFRIKLADLKPAAEDPAKETPKLTSEQIKERDSARLGDALAGGMVERLVHVRLVRGSRQNGKESFQIKIVNESPMILNGLALGGSEIRPDNPPATLAGLSLPPLKSLTVPASAEVVGRLHLKDSLRVHAADLSGL
jgi:hypothetical protein